MRNAPKVGANSIELAEKIWKFTIDFADVSILKLQGVEKLAKNCLKTVFCSLKKYIHLTSL